MADDKFPDSLIEDKLEKSITSFGTSGHIILPREHIGKRAVVTILKKDIITEFIKKLCEVNPELEGQVLKIPLNILEMILQTVIIPTPMGIDIKDIKAFFGKGSKLFYFAGDENEGIKKAAKHKLESVIALYHCDISVKLEQIHEIGEKLTKNLGKNVEINLGAKITSGLDKPMLIILGVKK